MNKSRGDREANSLTVSFGFDETRQKHHEKQLLQQGVFADTEPEPNNDENPNQIKGQTECHGLETSLLDPAFFFDTF